MSVSGARYSAGEEGLVGVGARIAAPKQERHLACSQVSDPITGLQRCSRVSHPTPPTLGQTRHYVCMMHGNRACDHGLSKVA